MDRAVLQERIDRFYDEVFPKPGFPDHAHPGSLSVWWIGRSNRAIVLSSPPIRFFRLKAIQHRLRWAGLPPEKYPFALVTSYENMHFTKEIGGLLPGNAGAVGLAG